MLEKTHPHRISVCFNISVARKKCETKKKCIKAASSFVQDKMQRHTKRPHCRCLILFNFATKSRTKLNEMRQKPYGLYLMHIGSSFQQHSKYHFFMCRGIFSSHARTHTHTHSHTNIFYFRANVMVQHYFAFCLCVDWQVVTNLDQHFFAGACVCVCM